MSAALAHQRSHGTVVLRFGLVGPRTALRHLDQAAPARALFPDPEPGELPVAALVNTAGGLAGGDSLRLSVAVEAGAAATATSPAAEKIYRSLGDTTEVANRLSLGEGALLEWLPQETILFDGARLRRRTEADLAPGARLLAAEMLVFGRAARGERFARGRLLDSWRLRRGGRLLWADALRLDDPAAALAAPFGLHGGGALATLLLAAPDAAAHLPLLREAAGPLGAATLPRDGLLLARWLGPATALRAAVGQAIIALRAAEGRAPRLPRLWLS
ncbi:urease accessory protein UreD [Roseomonas sp. OT10]|uniref:urease accessory protein UreD n=1 Tax=Roseomonas cutis TaxID=2897332 RepID=UPI001E520631|nr:urease accessory protein UreD [Roseomonas sp. OT10]UFN48147.1 urease accessory protein UreD [Roseomonas sp. OT10]